MLTIEKDILNWKMLNHLQCSTVRISMKYYLRNVLKEKTDVEKTTEQVLKDAATLHEYLRTYGSLKDPRQTVGCFRYFAGVG
ncbi:MAG: hypothetical protein ACLTL6_15225 [Holdemanella porci]